MRFIIAKLLITVDWILKIKKYITWLRFNWSYLLREVEVIKSAISMIVDITTSVQTKI